MSVIHTAVPSTERWQCRRSSRCDAKSYEAAVLTTTRPTPTTRVLGHAWAQSKLVHGWNHPELVQERAFCDAGKIPFLLKSMFFPVATTEDRLGLLQTP
eukprot:CAMPEP_0175880506 /NCGR_PEP_ID=MMETSP0107_2-20121207/42365_1 /TAXON_ID=195067 ORGANISM="Goniomonas pacifica, Strain CCMP1869" /NCGR_SAMPLE_ID=MMETSP0107_2 /ASSEMBLY_ACC=CAM_ASM_000203 /LENGTH=98 /DNA_ID=CAMNT_0017200277 /DNA_START=159 /DNA_END=455 /DNA_ORIENTATION=+